MSTELGLRDVLGLRVIAGDSAEEVGKVKGFVLDRTATRVERVHVGGRARKAELVDWTDIDGLAGDVMMVSAGGDVHRSRDESDSEQLGGDIQVLGARVLDTEGYVVGTIDDLRFDSESGEVLGVVTDSGRIGSERIHSLGTYGLVVDPG